MKKYFIMAICALALSGKAQQYPLYSKGMRASYSDPAISNLQITGANNGVVNTDRLVVGKPVKVSFTLSNNSTLNAVPEGSCQVVVSLGTNFTIRSAWPGVPDQLPIQEYFYWKILPLEQQLQPVLVGELKKDLPPGFAENVSFLLVPEKAGSSTVTAQVMISNHNNPVTILSDVAPMNNYAMKVYTNAKTPVFKFINLSAKPYGCTVNMNWKIYDEEKVAERFIIEASKNGENFLPVKIVLATGAADFGAFVDEFKNRSTLFLRIRTETRGGDVFYSEQVFVSGLCNSKFEVSLSPNPVTSDNTEITLTAKSGIFNGKYQFRLTNAAGKEIKSTEAAYSNQLQIKFRTDFLTGGTYYLTITGEDGISIALPFIRQ